MAHCGCSSAWRERSARGSASDGRSDPDGSAIGAIPEIDARLHTLEVIDAVQRLVGRATPLRSVREGFDHRVGHCGGLHMTAESMHASCLRCVGLLKRELEGPTPCAQPHITATKVTVTW